MRARGANPVWPAHSPEDGRGKAETRRGKVLKDSSLGAKSRSTKIAYVLLAALIFGWIASSVFPAKKSRLAEKQEGQAQVVDTGQINLDNGEYVVRTVQVINLMLYNCDVFRC